MTDRHSVPRDDWVWTGTAGHLIVSNMCRYHLRTEIGARVVSTVGEYHPGFLIQEDDKPVALGSEPDSLYETMVFPLSRRSCTEGGCACGERLVARWTELDAMRYATRGEAHAGHMAMCEKWAKAENQGGSTT